MYLTWGFPNVAGGRKKETVKEEEADEKCNVQKALLWPTVTRPASGLWETSDQPVGFPELKEQIQYLTLTPMRSKMGLENKTVTRDGSTSKEIKKSILKDCMDLLLLKEI